MVEPEVVATSPNRFKRPVPVCCGFGSRKDREDGRWKNGALEWWNTGRKLFSQSSNLPSFQCSKPSIIPFWQVGTPYWYRASVFRLSAGRSAFELTEQLKLDWWIDGCWDYWETTRGMAALLHHSMIPVFHYSIVPTLHHLPRMERVDGIAPSSQPWRGRILLLNHTRRRNGLMD